MLLVERRWCCKTVAILDYYGWAISEISTIAGTSSDTNGVGEWERSGRKVEREDLRVPCRIAWYANSQRRAQMTNWDLPSNSYIRTTKQGEWV